MGTKTHPARFPAKLPQFFVEMLTDPGDVVVDIFAGSNTTGEVCEKLGRHWLAYDNNKEYLAASAFRFIPSEASAAELKALYNGLMACDVEKRKSGGKIRGTKLMQIIDIYEALSFDPAAAIV
jgi:site-specific DNA-methyltransferase (cytosine-N4-specific)